MVTVRPKVEDLVLRSGEVVGPGHEISLEIDEAYEFLTRGLVDIVPAERRQVECAVVKPAEVR